MYNFLLKFSFLQNLFSLFSKMAVLSFKCIEIVLDWATLFCAHNSITILQINFFVYLYDEKITYLPTYQSIYLCCSLQKNNRNKNPCLKTCKTTWSKPPQTVLFALMAQWKFLFFITWFSWGKANGTLFMFIGRVIVLWVIWKHFAWTFIIRKNYEHSYVKYELISKKTL